MKKLYTSKTFSKTTGGRRHTPHPNTLLTALHLFCDMNIIGKESSIAFSAF